MAGREQVEKQSQSQQREDAAVDIAAATVIGTAALDSLLDEIDGVLESNAEEFVRSYVQKGGQ